MLKDSPTGRYLEKDAAAQALYEAMERLETDYAPGPPWNLLPEDQRDWYRECAKAVLATDGDSQKAKV